MRPRHERITVVVVDDDDLFRDLVVAILANEPDMLVVGQAGDGRTALALAEEFAPDVVVLDLNMPTSHGDEDDRSDRGGIEAAGAITRQVPATKIVMLTASELEADVLEALGAGADAYVLKDDLSGHLAGIVRTMADDLGLLLSPSIATTVLRQMRASATAGPSLSDRELDVLRLIGRGSTNVQIADDLFLSPHTVKRHVANILSKLGQASREEAVTDARRKGYLHEAFTSRGPDSVASPV